MIDKLAYKEIEYFEKFSNKSYVPKNSLGSSLSDYLAEHKRFPFLPKGLYYYDSTTLADLNWSLVFNDWFMLTENMLSANGVVFYTDKPIPFLTLKKSCKIQGLNVVSFYEGKETHGIITLIPEGDRRKHTNWGMDLNVNLFSDPKTLYKRKGMHGIYLNTDDENDTSYRCLTQLKVTGTIEGMDRGVYVPKPSEGWKQSNSWFNTLRIDANIRRCKTDVEVHLGSKADIKVKSEDWYVLSNEENNYSCVITTEDPVIDYDSFDFARKGSDPKEAFRHGERQIYAPGKYAQLIGHSKNLLRLGSVFAPNFAPEPPKTNQAVNDKGFYIKSFKMPYKDYFKTNLIFDLPESNEVVIKNQGLMKSISYDTTIEIKDELSGVEICTPLGIADRITRLLVEFYHAGSEYIQAIPLTKKGNPIQSYELDNTNRYYEGGLFDFNIGKRTRGAYYVLWRFIGKTNGVLLLENLIVNTYHNNYKA